MLIYILIILPLLLSILLIYLNFIISFKISKDREKPTPFECGFNPITSPHLPFSTNFFLISILFLIFDIEFTILVPTIYSMIFLNNLFLWLNSILFIMLILFIGLIYEWNEQSIKWNL